MVETDEMNNPTPEQSKPPTDGLLHEANSARQQRDQLNTLRRAIEQSPSVIVITNQNGLIEYVNPKFCALTGYSAAEVIGQNPSILKSGLESELLYQELWSSLLAGKEWRGEYRNRRKDGSVYWESAIYSAIHGEDGQITHFIKTAEDITARKQAEESHAEALDQLYQAAHRDAMTGLLNRRGFAEHLERAWQLAVRHRQPMGCIIVDVDRFKTLNDAYGHLAGDEIIREVASLIARVTRASDVVGRYGGDEFLVVLPLSSSEETRLVAHRILEAVRAQMFCPSSHRLHGSVSVGVAHGLPGEELDSSEALVKRADLALYRAKQLGRDRVCDANDLAQSDSSTTTANDISSARRRALIVDDEPLVARMLRRMLHMREWDCDIVHSGAEAMATVVRREYRYDLALVDRCLAEREDGIEVIRRLRQEDHTLVGVLITGQATTEAAIESLRAGAFDFLPKPITFEVLDPTLERVNKYRSLLLENEHYQRHLQDAVRAKSAALSETLKELDRSYEATLETLVAMLDARERKTSEHSKRVMLVSRLLAQRMGLSEEEVHVIAQGALLHDIGKIAIPDRILLKPGALDVQEAEIMKTHATVGFEILKSAPAFARAARIALEHQERWDGQGYPHGLAGEAICLGARIFAVADAYDAMRADRPYSPPKSSREAVAELVRHRGIQFDPGVVDLFLKHVDEVEKIGDWSGLAVG